MITGYVIVKCMAIAKPLITPLELTAELPESPVSHFVTASRSQIEAILKRQDDRLLIIVGPCSIHDEQAALEYSHKIAQQIPRFSDTLFLVMRVYFQKPRTLLGWKGLIHDPHLDESFDIHSGLRIARRLLLAINHLKVPAATEFLDMVIPQYIGDLIAWSAIGARTTESQIHRQLASGLPTPVGFKNSPSGDTQVAVNAVYAAQYPQQFLSVAADGRAALIFTDGNPMTHIILRGGHNGPNYDDSSIQSAVRKLQAKQLTPNIMVDCSHGNSQNEYARQIKVSQTIAELISHGEKNIIGVMMESHLVAGKQKLVSGQPLKYGQSITDPCLGWEETLEVLHRLNQAVLKRRSMMV